MRLAILIFTSIIALCSAASACYTKMRDGGYSKLWCEKEHGRQEVVGKDIDGASVRADCVTERFAVEADCAENWESNLRQAAKYGQAFKKSAMLVMVVEQKSDLEFVKTARSFISINKTAVELEAYDVTSFTQTQLQDLNS